MSAPIGNGIAAAVMAADQRVRWWPEKVRAAILVTAEDVDWGEWNQNFDGRDGVGVIYGHAAVEFAKNYTEVYPGNSPVQKGMGIGEIRASNWNSPLQYLIAIPNPIPTGKVLRVVLTWDSNPSLINAVNDISDLDLNANTTNNIYRYSTSYNDNIEIVHFYEPELIPGSYIAANISKYTMRIPSNATTDYFYYAIAWDWVDAHAP